MEQHGIALAVIFLVLLSSGQAQESVLTSLGGNRWRATLDANRTHLLQLQPGLMDEGKEGSATMVKASLAADADISLIDSVRLTLLEDEGGTAMTLTEGSRSASTVICQDEAQSVRVVTMAASSSYKASVEIELQSTDLLLQFGKHQEVTVTPSHPATFLVDPVADPAASNHDRYLLKVEADQHTKVSLSV